MSMPIHLRVACCVSIVWLPALSLAAQLHHVEYDPAAQRWTLRSGPVEYRLRRSGDGVAYDYFGPSGKTAWPSPGAAADRNRSVLQRERRHGRDHAPADADQSRRAGDAHRLAAVARVAPAGGRLRSDLFMGRLGAGTAARH